MSEVKHTAGPWTVRHAPIRGASNDTWCIDWSEDQEEVAEIVHGEANAILMSASPDLLEALQNLLGKYVALINSGDAGNWDPEEEKEVIAARTAIAKAKGLKP